VPNIRASGDDRSRTSGKRARTVAVVAALLAGVAPVAPIVLAQSPPAAPPAGQPPPPAGQAPAAGTSAPGQAQADADKPAPKLNADQLDALVAPIALYPDPLLSQSLMASTYPLEIIQAQQWVAKNKNLKGDELEKAVKAQDWEPAVQATALMPDLLKRLAEDITWTTNLGNAFLAQQQDVMDSVQRLRAKAKEAGKLESNDKMKVETKVVEQKTVVVIEPASPQVVYVPAYNPTVVWGPPVYAYPPVYYPPPPPPGAMLFTFSMGMMMGAAMHGGYCCGCGWGHSNTVVINNNNTFVNNRNVQNNVRNTSATSNWNHNPQHRGGAPYGDRATAAKYGGGAGGRGGAGNRGGAGVSTADRGAAGGSGMNRGGAGVSTADRGAAGGAGNRGGGYGGGGYGGGGYGGGGASVGNRSVPPSGGGSAFGGSGGGGNRAMASSSRGASSMGGGRGGGGRGGGGRR
jgi:hypothetical protein